MKYITLRNNVSIPQIGLGTWQITYRSLMSEVLENAFATGYRFIDTASAYSNEIAISKAISVLGIERQELFISDKVWNTSRGYDAVQEACRRSLKKLKTDYLDLYLIHWPASKKLYSDWAAINADTWRGMEQLYKDGLVKSIGVCNFKIDHLIELEKTAEIIPMINQLEMHPGYNNEDVFGFCMDNDIRVVASSPLGNGQILKNEILVEISKKYNRSPAQICLRWLIQKDVVIIPKTVKRERLIENFNVFDFEIGMQDMNMIDTIPYCGGIGIDSDEVTEFG